MGFAFFAGIINRILAHAVYPTQTTESEIAESKPFLAPRRLSSYTSDVMLYFAYGSNLNLPHLTDFLGTHGVSLDTELRGQHALLQNYRLRTNYFAGTHGAGACNIEPVPDHHVEGVVMAITPAIQDALRIKEGFPLRYHEIDVIVHTASTQASVRALTYVVTPTHRLDVDLPVAARYRALLLAGAKHFDFSKSYQHELHERLRTASSLLTTPSQNVSP